VKDTRLRFSGYLNKAWLRAGAQITEAIVHHYGRDELLRRLAPILVSIVRRRHGNGLAFLRHHHQCDWGLETRPWAN
jgi:hypothetical protein